MVYQKEEDFFWSQKVRRGALQTLERPEDRFHRVRHENLHNFEKNLDQNGLLGKKLEHFQIDRPKILRSKNLENVHRNFH